MHATMIPFFSLLPMRRVSAVRDPVTLIRRYIFMDMTSRSILVGTHMVLHSRLPLIPIGDDDALATADKRAQIWLFPER